LEGAATNPDIVVVSHVGETYGAIHLLAQSHAAPRTLYAMVEGGILRSSNLGETWETTGKGLEGRRIYALLVHPLSQVLYVGTDQGIYYLPYESAQ